VEEKVTPEIQALCMVAVVVSSYAIGWARGNHSANNDLLRRANKFRLEIMQAAIEGCAKIPHVRIMNPVMNELWETADPDDWAVLADALAEDILGMKAYLAERLK
jgi:hypothetical protein